MKVRIFANTHYLGLEEEINNFIKEEDDLMIIDIKYQTGMVYDIKEDTYHCYHSALIHYYYSDTTDKGEYR